MTDQPRITPSPDGDGVILHLPQISYLDTQVWSVDIGLTHEGLAALRNVLNQQSDGSQPMTEPTAYERLQQAAGKANEGAHLLAMTTLRDVHRECAALENIWVNQRCAGAEHVRMVLARIRAKLAPATGGPESFEDQAARLVRHLFDDQPDGEQRATLPAYMSVSEYRTDDGRTAWAWRCWGDGDCDGWLHLDAGTEQYARQRAAQHVTDRHQDGSSR